MSRWSQAVKSFSPGEMRISGEVVETRSGELRQIDLNFWVDNPRIYSIVHRSGDPIGQDEIQLQLLQRDHVKQLIQDIKHHGGLIHPLVVRDRDLSVLEGNSRLAAYRFLAERHPAEYGKVRCVLLPSELPEKLIYSYLNQEHIKGKSEWSPYEQAGVIYRLVKGGTPLEKLASELNLGARVARRMYETYEFMVDNGEDDPARWSYYEVYLQSRKVSKKRKSEPALDKRVIKEIRAGKVTAQQFRQMLPEVCDDERMFKKFLSERANLVGAYESLETEGKTEDLARLMKRIHDQVRGLSPDDFKGLSPRAAKTVEFQMGRAISRLSSLRKKVFD